MWHKRTLLALVIVAAFLVTGCGTPNLRETVRNVSDPLHALIYESPAKVQAAYDFAATHPDEIRKYPCYCGCVTMGHRDSLDCFVKDFDENGLPTYDRHAVGCTICVEIAVDVMRLRAQGQPSSSIRQYIDTTYSPFGPGTDTPLPRE